MQVLTFLLSIGAAGFLCYQGIHFYEYHDACVRTQVENDFLLKNPLCADPWQRRLHGPKQELVCQHAAAENAVHPLACAWKRSWDRLAMNQLWTAVTESHWLLFGIIAPTCCMIVIMTFWMWNQSSARQSAHRMQNDVLEMMTTTRVAGSPALQLPSAIDKPKKRKKVYQLVAEPSYHHYYREREPNNSSRLELLNI